MDSARGIVRVYRREWLWILQHTDKEKLEAYFAGRYEGRVRDDDVMIKETGLGWVLVLRLPNVVAEFASWSLAEDYVRREKMPDAVLVDKHSPEEDLLVSYGVKKLQAT